MKAKLFLIGDDLEIKELLTKEFENKLEVENEIERQANSRSRFWMWESDKPLGYAKFQDVNIGAKIL